jgi:hypothetical protein
VSAGPTGVAVDEPHQFLSLDQPLPLPSGHEVLEFASSDHRRDVDDRPRRRRDRNPVPDRALILLQAMNAMDADPGTTPAMHTGHSYVDGVVRPNGGSVMGMR